MDNEHKNLNDNLPEPEFIFIDASEKSNEAELVNLLDCIIKYFSFYNGETEIDDGERWKQALGTEKRCPDKIHQQVMKVFDVKLKTILKKEKAVYKAL